MKIQHYVIHIYIIITTPRYVHVVRVCVCVYDACVRVGGWVGGKVLHGCIHTMCSVCVCVCVCVCVQQQCTHIIYVSSVYVRVCLNVCVLCGR